MVKKNIMSMVNEFRSNVVKRFLTGVVNARLIFLVKDALTLDRGGRFLRIDRIGAPH
jgi:hypothetical protein